MRNAPAFQDLPLLQRWQHALNLPLGATGQPLPAAADPLLQAVPAGLVRVAEGGAAIAVEVWELPVSTFGSFVAAIPAPLGIGKTVLEDGQSVPGFICEPSGVEGAEDITGFGGWRAWLAKR